MIPNTKSTRHTAGFIRNTSYKALPTFKQQQRKQQNQSSSDEFSSFQNEERIREDSETQFSPYKFNPNNSQPPLPQANRSQTQESPLRAPHKNHDKYGSVRNLSNSRNKKQERQEEIKRILKKRAEVEKQLNEIGKIYEKRNHNDGKNNLKQGSINYRSAKPKQKIRIQYSFDDTDSDNEQIECPSQNCYQNIVHNQEQFTLSPNRFHEQPPKKQHKLLKKPQYSFEQSSVESKKNQEESSSFKCFQNDLLHHHNLNKQEEESKDQLKIRHEIARNNFIQENGHDSLENSEHENDGNAEQLIEQYKGDQFQKAERGYRQQYMGEQSSPSRMSRHLQPKYNKNQKPAGRQKIQKRPAQGEIQVQSPGFHKTRGGICFNLDINEFMHQQSQNKPNLIKTVHRVAKKKNPKEQILKRRQMAKNYDKQARMKVFGNY